MKRVYFFHVMLFTDVSGWEHVLDVLDEPTAEIWFHEDTPIPHYHVIASSDKNATAHDLHKRLGFFAGAKVEKLSDSYAYYCAKQYASSKGVRYVSGK